MTSLKTTGGRQQHATYWIHVEAITDLVFDLLKMNAVWLEKSQIAQATCLLSWKSIVISCAVCAPSCQSVGSAQSVLVCSCF